MWLWADPEERQGSKGESLLPSETSPQLSSWIQNPSTSLCVPEQFLNHELVSLSHCLSRFFISILLYFIVMWIFSPTPSVWEPARSVPGPQSCSEGRPAPKHPAVTAPIPADSWERDGASGNVEPHPGAQQSSDRPGSTQCPGARGQRGDGDAGGVRVASVLRIRSYSLWPVSLPSL